MSIPLSLVERVKELGYADKDALTWLREAVYYSAPITHRDGNRRYGDLLLTVVGKNLEDLVVFVPDCDECQDSKKFVAYEACPSCPGLCDMDMCSGSVAREWPCPMCALDKQEPLGYTKRKKAK